MKHRRVRMHPVASLALLVIIYLCGLAILNAIVTPVWAATIAASWSVGGIAVMLEWATGKGRTAAQRSCVKSPVCWLTAAVFGPLLASVLEG